MFLKTENKGSILEMFSKTVLKNIVFLEDIKMFPKNTMFLFLRTEECFSIF